MNCDFFIKYTNLHMVKLNSIILLGMSYFYVNKTKTFAFKIDLK